MMPSPTGCTQWRYQINATKVVVESNSLADIDDITGDDGNGEAGSTIDNIGNIALDVGGVDDNELSSNNPFGVTAPPGYHLLWSFV